jgi:excisionase family DNA binding protein
VRDKILSAPPPEILFDAEAASKSLAISPRLLWSLTKSREIPSLRLGRRVLYPRKALEIWVEQRTLNQKEA